MRIALTLLALTLLLAAGNAQAFQIINHTELPVVDCTLQPWNVGCTVCFDDPRIGALPISPGGSGSYGVGVAANPQDLENGAPYGPYTGVFVSPGGRC